MSTLERIQEQREEVLTIARRYGATKVRIIGSVARGEDDEESDIDFLVDLAPGRSLFDLGGMLMDLNLLFGKHVDITTEKGLKRRIRDRVLSEAVSL
ncbi:MAG: nucleotidyltransferase family protein [Firmicutes bacterium]|nr:nucleotidyltransferase family protein [Dethiobacter sp.]MBS3887779.1 nucleotidyltransferase family protein [Bacillota bacterium]MBS4054877.1 nucleotidyltransferase family protein [Thermaerobacter sp.]